MNLRRYQNELIVGIAFVVMLAAFFYKQGQIRGQETQVSEMQNAITEMKEVIALKEIWGNKNLDQKVKQLQKVAAKSKIKWSQKSKKVTAAYKGLTANELNKLVKTVLNLGVEIKIFEVKKADALYNVELTCKW